jgi:hypothetical protein
MGGVSPVLYRPVVPARLVKTSADVRISALAKVFTISYEKSKILSRLLSVLSLHRKFVHNHNRCPNSATTLTSSQMEAVLDFGRGCQKLAIILRGCEGGGAEIDAGRLPLITFMGGGGRSEWGMGRSRKGEGENKFVLAQNAVMCMVDHTLSLFLISPFCCCSLSRYKKVPQERYNLEFESELKSNEFPSSWHCRKVK